MRLATSIVISLFVSVLLFLIVKFWGKSQVFIDYNHPFYTSSVNKSPLLFIELTNNWSVETAASTREQLSADGYWLNVASTSDEKTVALKKPIEAVRRLTFDQVRADSYLGAEILELLKDQKVIVNFLENPISGPDLVQDFLKESGLVEKNNFAILSPYEPPMKFLKEKQPTFIFGTTKPEILRIKALESVGLIEASTFRADVVVHPLKFYGEGFFTDNLVREMKKRFKRLIIGPIPKTDWENPDMQSEIKRIDPFAVVITP